MFTTRMTAKAAAATLLLAALAAAPAHAAWQAADARHAAARTAMIVIDGVPGSAALLRGDYAEGLAQSLAAYQRSPGHNVVPLALNLCAAHALLGQMKRAHAACARAVAASAPLGSGLSSAQFRAIALVNRGVLQQLDGDRVAAQADFDRAAGLFPTLGVAASNREWLRSSVTVGDTAGD